MLERIVVAMEPVWPRFGSEPINFKEHATFLYEAFAHLKTVQGHATAIPVDIINPLLPAATFSGHLTTMGLSSANEKHRRCFSSQAALRPQSRQERPSLIPLHVQRTF